MVKKTEVIICDTCNERVASQKCDICKIDLCKSCSKEVSSALENDYRNRILALNLCSKCRNRTLAIVKESDHREDIIALTNKFFIDLIKKKGILKQIEKGNEKVGGKNP